MLESRIELKTLSWLGWPLNQLSHKACTVNLSFPSLFFNISRIHLTILPSKTHSSASFALGSENKLIFRLDFSFSISLRGHPHRLKKIPRVLSLPSDRSRLASLSSFSWIIMAITPCKEISVFLLTTHETWQQRRIQCSPLLRRILLTEFLLFFIRLSPGFFIRWLLARSIYYMVSMFLTASGFKNRFFCYHLGG